MLVLFDVWCVNIIVDVEEDDAMPIWLPLSSAAATDPSQLQLEPQLGWICENPSSQAWEDKP